MKRSLIKNTLNSIPLKLVALTGGYCLWMLIGHLHEETITLKIPVCFYQTEQRSIVEAPEQVAVKLRGKKQDLFELDVTSLAMHINAQDLHLGENRIVPTTHSVFLPGTIKMVHCNPSLVSVTVA